MNPEELSKCANEAAAAADVLSKAENAEDETVVRGLYVVASSIAVLAAAAYEIAAALRTIDLDEVERFYSE